MFLWPTNCYMPICIQLFSQVFIIADLDSTNQEWACMYKWTSYLLYRKREINSTSLVWLYPLQHSDWTYFKWRDFNLKEMSKTMLTQFVYCMVLKSFSFLWSSFHCLTQSNIFSDTPPCLKPFVWIVRFSRNPKQKQIKYFWRNQLHLLSISLTVSTLRFR